MKNSLSQKTHIVMFLGTLGAFFGAGVILYDAQSTDASRRFLSTPQFHIWLLLVCAQPALFTIVIGPLLNSLKQLKRYSVGNRKEIVLSGLIFFILFSVPIVVMRFGWVGPIPWPLAHFALKSMILITAGFSASLLSLIGMLLCSSALRTTFANSNIIVNNHIDPEQIQQYLRFREHLQLFLWIPGIMIGSATLAAGALRGALLQMGIVRDNVFPSLLVLDYGAYFTLILLLVYAPTHNSLINAGYQILDVFFPIPSPMDDSWVEVLTKRQKLEEFLQLKVSTEQNIRTNVAIFAPLLGGVISTLLK